MTTVIDKAPFTTIDELLNGADELAALPQVVMRVIDLTADPKATATDLEKVISADQAMAARILTLANSAYYGLPRSISTVREAVVFLGFKTVRNLAMTITTFNMFLGKSDQLSLARRGIWRHSLDTAQCARLITSRLHVTDRDAFGADEAFTCGLLHDIGKLVMDSQMPAAFGEILARVEAEGARFHEVELEVAPFSHSLIGAALATRWNLPASLGETIAFHHTPRAAQANPRLTAVVSFADEAAHFLAEGVDASEESEPLAELTARCADTLGLFRFSPDATHSLLISCRAELDKGLASSLFG